MEIPLNSTIQSSRILQSKGDGGGIISFVTYLDDLITYLTTQGFSNIFKYRLDETGENQIAIIPWSGRNPTDVKSGEENPHNPKISVQVRHTDADTANSICTDIYKLMRLKTNVWIGQTRFNTIKALGTPMYISYSRTGASIFYINFDLIIEE